MHPSSKPDYLSSWSVFFFFTNIELESRICTCTPLIIIRSFMLICWTSVPKVNKRRIKEKIEADIGAMVQFLLDERDSLLEGLDVQAEDAVSLLDENLTMLEKDVAALDKVIADIHGHIGGKTSFEVSVTNEVAPPSSGYSCWWFCSNQNVFLPTESCWDMERVSGWNFVWTCEISPVFSVTNELLFCPRLPSQCRPPWDSPHPHGSRCEYWISKILRAHPAYLVEEDDARAAHQWVSSTLKQILSSVKS